MELTKHITDQPLLDNIVYYSKLLNLESILKDEATAVENETLESIKTSDMYIACKDGIANFDLFFSYTMEQLAKVGLDDVKYALDKQLIPLDKRPQLVTIASTDYINNYVELNNYYRKLNGLPDNGDPGIYVDYVTELPPNFIHLMNQDEIQTLDNLGYLATIIAQNPDKEYLNHLTIKKIDPYDARKADRFAILYYPNINVSEVSSRFLDIFEKNRIYTLKCVYKEAFKLSSDFYDNFIMVFIKIQTIVDMIANIPDYIIKRDLFDLQSIKYMFESNGIEFFPEIPLKYQISMLKNMNTLVKFKSTTKNMIDICSIFGFDNIEIFKYYLLKDRNMDENGDFIFETTTVTDDFGNETIVDDNEANFTLKFIKVPIEEDLDGYIRDKTNQVSYEDITKNDEYWTGDKSPEQVKKEILDYEFNYLRSKYISIDTIYDMDKLTFEITYFFNIIFDNVHLENNLLMSVPYIDGEKKFKIAHLVYYLYTLLYEQDGYKDSIFDTNSKVMHVRGFNFEVDLTELANYIHSQGFTMEELGITYKLPITSFLTMNQLLELFINNKKCYDHVVQQLINPKSKKMYDIYKHIYDALMITTINDKLFTLADGSIATTYTEYFKEKDPAIYNHLQSIRDLDSTDKENKINETIANIVYTLEDYVDSKDFTFLFANLPSISSDIIRGYMFKVINFFKSYKIELTHINNIYKFSSPLDNKIIILDELFMNKSFTVEDYIHLKEKTLFDIVISWKEKIPMVDYILIAYILNFTDRVEIEDIIKELKVILTEEDYSHFQFNLKAIFNSIFTKVDRMNIEDVLFIESV